MVKKEENNGNKVSAIVRRKEKMMGILNDEEFIRSLEKVIPKHLTPERIVKMALVASSRQPKLYDCTPQSFLQAVMRSAEVGLDCSGTLGQGWLVPYYNSKINAHECQFIAGYQGLISLARRSGEIARIESRLVYEKDFFDAEYGLEQRLTHKPSLEGDRGEITCVYAIAELKDGSKQVEIMTIDEVKSIQKRSKAKDSGPWITDFGEMARKTVIRRIAKYLPLSTEFQRAIETDDQQFDFNDLANTVSKVQSGVEGLKERLNKKQVESRETGSENPPEPELAEKRNKEIKMLKKAEKKAKDKKTKEEVPRAKYQCKRCPQIFAEMPANNQCPICYGDVIEIREPEPSKT